MIDQPGRIGAYVLPGDPVWLRRTLVQYYPLLDELVIPVPTGEIGWSGKPIPVNECLRIIENVDTRKIARRIRGRWVDQESPILADTAQRQAALDALNGSVDWVIQLDNDEYVPRPEILLSAIRIAEQTATAAVEIPMRVLFRRTRRYAFEVVEGRGRPHHEYPGAVVVRPDVRLRNARQVEGPFCRLVSEEARGSLQLERPEADGELRISGFDSEDAIVHNSWGRSAADIRQKIRSWGHSTDLHPSRYYWFRWYPSPLIWWSMRDFHPFSKGLWPRLRRSQVDLADANEYAGWESTGLANRHVR